MAASENNRSLLYLRQTRGYAKGRVFEIVENEILMGRHPHSDIVFHPEKDADASLEHAKLAYDHKGWTLTDRNSRNGTWLNGKKIDSHVLSHGDRLEFGKHGPRFTVVLEGEHTTRIHARPIRSIVGALLIGALFTALGIVFAHSLTDTHADPATGQLAQNHMAVLAVGDFQTPCAAIRLRADVFSTTARCGIYAKNVAAKLGKPIRVRMQAGYFEVQKIVSPKENTHGANDFALLRTKKDTPSKEPLPTASAKESTRIGEKTPVLIVAPDKKPEAAHINSAVESEGHISFTLDVKSSHGAAVLNAEGKVLGFVTGDPSKAKQSPNFVRLHDSLILGASLQL